MPPNNAEMRRARLEQADPQIAIQTNPSNPEYADELTVRQSLSIRRIWFFRPATALTVAALAFARCRP
jgi:hypothetical protein